MHTTKTLLIGAPGTGKTSVLKTLEAKGFCCFGEVSRRITLEAQRQGIDQLFLENPLLFSQKLLEGRIDQYKQAEKTGRDMCFIDRGIPDVAAYMQYKNETVPAYFTEADQDYLYDHVFLFPLWEDIYHSDNERYENFEEAQKIQSFIENAYTSLGYQLIEIPRKPVVERVDFILNHLNYDLS